MRAVDTNVLVRLATRDEHETLTPRDWEAFLAALDDADRPRPRLAAAVRRYQSRRERDAG